MKKEWYVVNTVTGYEYKVKEKLEMMINSMELQKNIYRVVVPETIIVTEPRYFKNFASILNEETLELYKHWAYVTGFIGSSGKGAKPIPLSPEEVDRVLGDMGLSRIDVTKELQEGNKVRIIDGPFKDMEGTIESVDMKTQKLNVNVDLFGQVTKVEVDLADIASI